ncbi:MAG: nucleotidyltransferase family protein, partial [Armatimonadetes bacterium]|nr:nucleotidyltransferase family protein [Armatimonadota bacterium]
ILKDYSREIILVAPSAQVPLDFSFKSLKTADDGKNILESLKSGISQLSKNFEKVLITPCDIPLLTAPALENFLKECEKEEAQIYYSFVRKENHLKKFPKIRHTYVKLKEGVFCGGGLILLNPKVIAQAEKLFEKITENRKNPLKLAQILGLKTIFKFIFKTLSIKDLEERASYLLETKVKGIESLYPEIAVNVDHLLELKLVEEHLSFLK